MKILSIPKTVQNGFTCDYEEEGNIIRDGLIQFQNYFFMTKDGIDYLLEFLFPEAEEYNSEDFNYSKTNFKTMDGRELTKITAKNNFALNKLRKDLQESGDIWSKETFEIDFSPFEHWALENQSFLTMDYDKKKINYYDIETDDRTPLKKDMKGKVIAQSRILGITLGNTIETAETFVLEEDTAEAEEKLLRIIFEKFKAFEIHTAWNGSLFDDTFLIQRGKVYGIDFEQFLFVDQMSVFKLFEKRTIASYSLDSVGEVFANIRKIPQEKGAGKIYRLWKDNKEDFIKYNRRDVEIQIEIEKVEKFFDIVFTISEITKALPTKITGRATMIANALTKKYHDKLMVVPNIPRDSDIDKPIGGGYSYCYLRGLHEQLIDLDLNSCYPNSIRSIQISPETYRGEMEIDREKAIAAVGEENYKIMLYAEMISPKFIQNKKFNSKKFDKVFKTVYPKANLTDLMFQFIDKYENAKVEGCTVTPVDFNLDTTGWAFHRSKKYQYDEHAAMPEFAKEALDLRDSGKQKVKELTKQYGKDVFTMPEYISAYNSQYSYKTLANLMYGALAFKKFRFYQYELGDSVTQFGRWILKKSIIKLRSMGYTITNGDTDSIFCRDAEGKVPEEKEINTMFFDYYKELFESLGANAKCKLKYPATGEMLDTKFSLVFKYEHVYKTFIVSKKKRYYFLESFKDKNGQESTIVNSKGGAFVRKDTIKLAGELQKEIAKDFLEKNFDSDIWRTKVDIVLEKIKQNSFDANTLKKSIIYARDIATFTKVVPAHIRLAARLLKEGKQLEIGDSIEFLVGINPAEGIRVRKYKDFEFAKYNLVQTESKGVFNPAISYEDSQQLLDKDDVKYSIIRDTKICAITPEEYTAGNPLNLEYYVDKLLKPTAEIANLCDRQFYEWMVEKTGVDFDFEATDEDDDSSEDDDGGFSES